MFFTKIILLRSNIECIMTKITEDTTQAKSRRDETFVVNEDTTQAKSCRYETFVAP